MRAESRPGSSQSPVVRPGWVPGGACLGVGTQPGSAAACAVREPAHRAGTELCAAAALAHRSLLSVSPLVLLSQTCHLAPSGAGTPVGHFLSPLASELILASPSLIFLHCLSPLSRPQLSPPGAVSCSSDCMSPGTAPLMAVVLAGGHPRTPPPALPRAPSLAGPAPLAPSQAPARGSCALFVLRVPAVPHCLAVASNPWLPGGQNGFSADLQGWEGG